MSTDPFLFFFDPVCSILHYLAALGFLVASPRLLRLGRGNTKRVTVAATFAVGAVVLLMASATYHALPEGSARDMFQRLDHAAIWVLIAGTFTPVTYMTIRGRTRVLLLAGAWIFAVVGVVGKLFFFNDIPEWVALTFYIGFGWLGVLTTVGLRRLGGWRFVVIMLGGGVSYTVGALLEFARTPIVVESVVGPHELFHLAVVIGVGLHWYLVGQLLRIDPADNFGN